MKNIKAIYEHGILREMRGCWGTKKMVSFSLFRWQLKRSLSLSFPASIVLVSISLPFHSLYLTFYIN